MIWREFGDERVSEESGILSSEYGIVEERRISRNMKLCEEVWRCAQSGTGAILVSC